MEAELFVIVDSEGSYVSHIELADAHELANDQGLEPCRRTIRVTLKLPIPEFIEVEATLPAESTQAIVAVK